MDGECVSTEGHCGSVYGIGILGPKQLVSGSLDATIKIWDTGTTATAPEATTEIAPEATTETAQRRRKCKM